MMEEQNNKGTQIDTMVDGIVEDMKEQITAEVRAELQSKGVTIIDNDYSGAKEVVKIVDDYNKAKDKIQVEMESNEATYKEDVAKIKNYELHLDLKDLQDDTIEKLDGTIEKAKMLQDRAIKDKQSSKEYLEAKGEALQLLQLLKDVEIPVSQLMDIINPMVEASDVRMLGIAHTLLQNNITGAYAIDRAIDEINISLEQRELHTIVDTMKDYVRTGNDGLSYFAYRQKYSK
ncbi:MAG: hypothetical protein SOZ04_06060 [Bacilli bacterium]|nr:hypothetical protein [Bacilli bacterium]